MSNRIYNVLFHTHTVSGIVISVALFVIFFAGSFSFFRDEIVGWERNEPIAENATLSDLDFDVLLDTLDQRYALYGRDVALTRYFNERRINVSLSATKDTTATEEAKRRNFFYLDPQTSDTYTYQSNYSIGELLYRLHFFAQLNLWGTSGYILAGLVAFFFLFAIITGVLVHWKKIVSNFYVFRPKASLKNLWTDAHTALGVIGLPYQFVYAVTGACLIIGTSVMSPAVVAFVYDGDTNQLYEDFGFNPPHYEWSNDKLAEVPSINAFVARAEDKWDGFEVRNVEVFDYGDQNMHIGIEGRTDYKAKFAGRGEIVFNATTGEEVKVVDPFTSTSYQNAATAVITQLHFGDFGGMPLKVVYFILGIISCFVIISGVMIWLVARDKKHIPEKQRKFNAWVVWIYLAVCLSMFPATAITFLAVKVFLLDFDATRMTFIYQVFFYSWLVLSVLFAAKRDNFFTNKYNLLGGAVLGLLVPVANGIISGNWPWVTFPAGYYQIFVVDVFWLAVSLTALIIGLNLKKPDKQVKSPPRKRVISHLQKGVDVSLTREESLQQLN
ncbi:PepSY domain-containing protein [Echinicola strongylocentroti]|uniref:PepSY domain-containing protein n=1 Tax=Echinicola strongylocentroti TaxID=1795355 RepID=A0A2Z4IQ42_9BACT|nr:PepSY-associated TM helix domain-containing protein [Echinicola strongylocentroti]AWW32819.1 PepSY domain-containing protein [Echinicola strongylocentroti]